MDDFYVSDDEKQYLIFVIEEDIELGSIRIDFMSELLTAVKRGDTIRFGSGLPGAEIITLPTRKIA